MNNKFAENLKKIRKENNLSQEDLAEELGVSRQAISKWESGVAYPEMDKIIALCDKFNLNIDDLLHKDVKEVKGEEESKKKINDYIDDFLKFITDSFNLFCNMNFKSKIKCLLEQVIIATILFLLSSLINSVLGSVFSSILRFLPQNINHFINGILDSIIIVFCLIASIVIMVHLFKTRYLDYYDKYKKEEIKDEDNNKELKETKEDKKIAFKQKEDKIIIRDPKHSEYKFINALFKIIVGFFKFILLCIVLSLSFVLIGLFCSFIISLLAYKTGLFFIGLMLLIISSGIITIITILLMLNFVFNRKNNKKMIIWSFILSLILFGVGSGLVFNGSLDFEYDENYETVTKIVTKEYNMQDNLVLFPYKDIIIEYQESNIDNIKIDYTVNKYCDIIDFTENNQVMAWSSCKQFPKMIKEFIKNMNNKKIIPIDTDIEKVIIYASKNNIDKLNNNLSNFYEEIAKEHEIRFSYEKEIDRLERENEKLEEKLEELEEKLENYN